MTLEPTGTGSGFGWMTLCRGSELGHHLPGSCWQMERISTDARGVGGKKRGSGNHLLAVVVNVIPPVKSILIVTILRLIVGSFLVIGKGDVSNVPSPGTEYCDTEIFRASCSESEVVMVDRALYGRMRLGKCVEMDMGYIGCYTNVLATADRRCSGRRSCEIRVPDAELENTRPCLKELKTYLEVSFRCLTVQRVTSDYCLASEELHVHPTSGFIASIMTSDIPHCDGLRHPWVITGFRGQIINLTLYDFAMESFPHSLTSSNSNFKSSEPDRTKTETSRRCRGYGRIEDSGVTDGQQIPICGSDTLRISHLYLSTGNVVRLWVTAGMAPRDLQRFVIHYSVVGCPDLTVPNNAWFQRTIDGQGIVGCKGQEVTWRVVCHNQTWTGSVQNCSIPEALERSNIKLEGMKPSLNIVLPVVVLSGAVVLGSAVLIIAALVRQRRVPTGKPTVAGFPGEDLLSCNGESPQVGLDHIYTVPSLTTLPLPPPPPPVSNTDVIRQAAPDSRKFRYVELGSRC